MKLRNTGILGFLFTLVAAIGLGAEPPVYDQHRASQTAQLGDCLIINLSGGPSASSYPVTYLSSVPPRRLDRRVQDYEAGAAPDTCGNVHNGVAHR